MAYVGTPTFQNNPTYTLASIIQGEAGGEGLIGQQAVASVIANRAATNFNGYGTSLTSQALAPNQFQGQATPSAQAIQVAQQLQAGQISDPTNGALYYANPSASSGPLSTLNSSNSLQIGNHYFSDQYGPASQNYMNGISGGNDQTYGTGVSDADLNNGPDLNTAGIAPQGTSGYNAMPIINQPESTAVQETGVYDQSKGFGTISGDPNGAPAFTQPNQGAVTGDIASQGTGSDFNTIATQTGLDNSSSGTSPANLSDGLYAAGATPNNSPTAGLPGPLQGLLGGQTQSPTASAPSGGILGGEWDMLGVTAVTSAGQQESSAITQAATTTAQATTSSAQQTNQTNAQDTASTNATNTSIAQLAATTLNTDTNSFLDNAKDIFVRGIIAFFGLVLLLGAVLYFMKKQDLIPEVVPA